MENQIINNFLFSLREEGYDFYNIEDVLLEYKNLIKYLSNGGYSNSVNEFNFDMEFREDAIEPIKIIIKNNIITATNSEKKFLQDLEELDKIFYEITMPAPRIIEDLPFWWNRILKKAGQIYAEDVKLMYGIDIEIME